MGPSEARGISVVIVSYNVREYLDACLQSIHHAAARFEGTVEVIVFDNDSRDGTLQLLKPRYSKVIWLASDRNLGFGSGCNRGAAMATQPLLLFLNPDTLISESTFSVMWDFFQSQEEIGVAGCKIVNRDGSLQLACKRSFPSPRVAAYKFSGLSGLFPKSRVFGRYNLTFLDENKTHEVDAVSGSFLCVERSLFAQVGGFDEDFFMYGEDLDICFRIKLLGKRNFYHPATSVIHFKGESAKSKPVKSFMYFYESMIIFSRKHFELRTLPISVFYLGATLLALSNFISARLQRWPRWLVDLALVNGLLAGTAYAYMHSMQMPHIILSERNLYWFWHILVSLFVVLPLAYIGDYGRRVPKVRLAFYTLCGSFLGFFAFSYFFREEAYSRIVFAATAFLSILTLSGWRSLITHGGHFIGKIMGSMKRVAIIGISERATQLAELMENEQLRGYEFVGFLSLIPPARLSHEVRQNLIGDVNSLPSLAKKVELDQVIVAVEEGAYQAALQILAENLNGSLEVKLLVGEPKAGSISLVDLNFGK